jgi:hypothetical protein
VTMTDDPAVPLAPGRTCGSCTACCKIMTFDGPGFFKPQDTVCPQCTGQACGIHPTRPQSCREFYCLWRQVPTMPDAIRPDRIGVMFTIEGSVAPNNPFEKEFVIGRAVNGTADFEHPSVKATLDIFVRNGDLPIWLSAGGQRNLLHPHAELRDAILNPQSAPQALLGEVQLWRKRLGLGVN